MLAPPRMSSRRSTANGRHGGVEQVDAIEKSGDISTLTIESRMASSCDSPFLSRSVVVIGQQIVALRLRQRPAVGARGEPVERVEVLRLGLGMLLFQTAKGGVDTLEVIADGLRSDRIVVLDRPAALAR